ncbi:hypothetical protein ENBRE01_1075 [Enteropsectra breve]|nr:hypothetical protein ENBRE01_1075 [Enteropsectra breve]
MTEPVQIMGSSKKQEEEQKSPYENVDIKVDAMKSREIDMMPPKTKKRRQIDEYDYNDPFFEPFEGEMMAVELECKLENFFVYQGPLQDDAKKIARKYNRVSKKEQMAESINSIEKKLKETENDPLAFDFEADEASISQSSRYKKDSRFNSLLCWAIEQEEPKSALEKEISMHLINGLQSLNNEKSTDVKQKPEESELHDMNADGIEKEKSFVDGSEAFDRNKSFIEMVPVHLRGAMEALHLEIKAAYAKLKEELLKATYFNATGKAFLYSENSALLDEILHFIIIYMKFRSYDGKSINRLRNNACEYILNLFSEGCANTNKLKYFVKKRIENVIVAQGHDLEKIAGSEVVAVVK